MPEVKLTAKVDMTEVDEAIKKANRLVELLQEASTIADSLSGKFGLCVELPQTYTNNLVIKNDHTPNVECGAAGRIRLALAMPLAAASRQAREPSP